MTVAAKIRFGNQPYEAYRRSLFRLLFLGIFLSGCITLATMKPGEDVNVSSNPPPEFTFEQHEVGIGSAKRQTVLTGFFLGGAIADLAVVNIDENNDRRLRIYAFEGGDWAPNLDSKLRPAVLFVDVAKIGGRDRLITYEPGRLNWFDP